MRCSIVRIPIGSPDDLTGLERLIEQRSIVPSDVVAVMGKTEGNGCVNDFSRGLAVRALTDFFRARIGEEAASRILLIMSGGTEGVLSPHFTVVSRSMDPPDRAAPSFPKALSVGVARTAPLLPEQIGRAVHVEMTALSVRTAMRDAQITDPGDVHFVQIKCPLLTPESMADAALRRAMTVTDDTYKSMAYSRGASALGVALALGEVDASAITDAGICSSWDHCSSVASASAGSELSCCEVLVFGNSAAASGDLVIGHDVMRDVIDIEAIQRAAASAGHRLDPARPPAAAESPPERGAGGERSTEIVQVFAKAEAHPGGVVRGRRHTMLSDSDINHTRHARAVVGGIVAAIFGDPMIYVSGGAEHQGPSGGGPIAVIARRIVR